MVIFVSLDLLIFHASSLEETICIQIIQSSPLVYLCADESVYATFSDIRNIKLCVYTSHCGDFISTLLREVFVYFLKMLHLNVKFNTCIRRIPTNTKCTRNMTFTLFFNSSCLLDLVMFYKAITLSW